MKKKKKETNSAYFKDLLSDEEVEAAKIDFDDLEDDYIDVDDKQEIDKVQIFGTDGRDIIPILTDAEGRLLISGKIFVTPLNFKEKIINNLKTRNALQFTASFDAAKNITTSFIVRNKSTANKVTIQLQDSPDNVHFQIDLPETEVEPNGFKVLTPTRFLRYLRVAYRSTQANQPAWIDVFYQAQEFRNG